MRPIAALVISIAMALCAIGLAVAAPGGPAGGREATRLEVQAASGAAGIANSRAGQAVFNATAMRPGEGVSGTVTIGNDGDLPGRFAVQASGVQDVLGPNGGKLSELVELVVLDVTDARNPVSIYTGPPAGFEPVELGVLAAGDERDYLFSAALPATADNRFQGAGLTLGVQWSATTIPSAATPTPTPTTPVATPTPTPTTPAPPTTTPPAPVSLADELGMPAATSCVKKGTLKLRVKAPRGTKIVSAVVKVNGKVKARLKGKKAARPVTLRGLKKTTKLAVTIKASNKRTYSATRIYRACK